ncbi:hypothetical protein V8F06_007752 [Rhypophila decipiens]
MPSFFTTGLLAALAGSAAAHMSMDFPAPFRAKSNPFAAAAGNIDYSLTSPLNADGSNYPCKGYISDLDTPSGQPTASFALGQTYNISISGGAAHGGGSCQISLSYDRGQTFTVIESIIGGCPLQKNYDFTIPSDAQAGEALLSWSWHNQIGNREMYQNCAAVTITGGAAKRAMKERAAAYSARPQIFVANIGNGCSVGEGAPVQYPNPGPDVAGTGAGAVPPTGNCGPSGPSGGGDSDPAPAPPQAPAPTTAAAPPAAPAPTSAQAPVPPAATTAPGGVFHTIPTDKVGPTQAPVGAPSAAPVAPVPTTEAAPPAPVPTTLATATKSSVAAPIGTGTPDSGSGSGGSAGAHATGSACSPEGEWNCIDGKSFQRCASGTWSAVMQMAPGTKCTPGESPSLAMGPGRRIMRVARSRKW